MKYRKKPVVIEAFQMTEARRMDNSDWPHWLHEAWNGETDAPGTLQRAYRGETPPDPLAIITLEGWHLVSFGDWIIRGVKGELYPCKPDIFAATYDAVEDAPAALAARAAADAAAQADYEARIRSALTITPAPDPAQIRADALREAARTVWSEYDEKDASYWGESHGDIARREKARAILALIYKDGA